MSNREKCRFFTDKVQYLGQVIRLGKLEAAGHIKDVIKVPQDLERLTDLK